MKNLILMTAIMALAVGGVSAGTINVDVNDPACVSGTGQPDPYAVVYCNIQDAITDATSGDIINVAAGTYYENLSITKTLTINGAGRDVVILDPITTAYGIGVSSGGNNVTIKNLTINSGTAMNFLMHVSGVSNFWLENAKIVGAGRMVLSGGSPLGGVDLINVSTATIKSVEVKDLSRNGVSLTASTNISLEDLAIDNIGHSTGWAGVALYTTTGSNSAIFSGVSTIDNTSMGVYIEDMSTQTVTLTASPGTITFSGQSVAPLIKFGYGLTPGLEATALGLGLRARLTSPERPAPYDKGTAFYYTVAEAIAAGVVDPVGKLYAVVYDLQINEWFVGPGILIQRAVNAATVGDIINVADGTYGADPATGKGVYITKADLSLIGESETGTIIDGAIGGVGSSGSYWPKGIHVQANNVTVQNFTVQGFTGDLINTGGYGVLYRDYAHDTEGEGWIFYDGCTVDNVTVQNCYSVVYALCFTHLTVSNCILSNNYSDGMFIARGSDYATIHDNTVTNSGDHGIWVGNCWMGLRPSHNAIIYNNTVDGAREGGISFVGSNTAVIHHNSITNAAGEGWSVGALNLKDGPTNVEAHHNHIYNNSGTWGGYNGTGHGVGIDGAASNIDLHHNSIYGNSGLGVYNGSSKGSAGTWEPRLNEDGNLPTIDDMISVGGSKGSKALVLAEQNWWGDASGPYNATTNPSATGDAASDDVDYSPWWGADYVDDPHTSPWTLYVNTSNNSTIQEGIDVASGGDVVNVAAGTYTITSTINVNKEVTITGDIGNPANVIVQYSPADITQTIFEIQASNVTIEGIKTISGRYAVAFTASDPTGCTISHCILDQPGRRGINFWSGCGTGHTVEYTTISNVGPSADADPGNETGIMIYYPSGALNLTIQHNTFTNMYRGIWLFAGNSIVIDDNTFTSIKDQGHPGNVFNGAPAIDLHNSAATSTANRVEVTNNTVSDCYWQGIFVYKCPYTYVYNNTLHNCNYYGIDGAGDWDYAGIHVQESNDGTEHSDHCIVDGNTVYDCINGIQIWSDSCQVTNNEIYDMGLTYADERIVGGRTYKNSGILVGSNFGNPDTDHDPTGVVIQNNSIHDNYWGLFYSADLTNGVNASGNWLGDNTPSGVAAEVSSNVDYTPWLDVGTDKEPGTPGFQGDFSVLDVDDDSPQTGTIGRIQEGVDLVTGSTVNVMAGTYEAQVVIGKELTLVGAGKDVTIIQSPTTLTEHFTTSADNYPIVYIHDADVTINGFTIDGLGRGNANYRFNGIGFWNAGGSVSNVDLTGVRNTPFSGAQHGVAIYAYNSTGGPYTIDLSGVTIDDFQKNGTALNGDGLTANLSNCTVTGHGLTSITAQNGIQIGFGAGGTITDCSVSDIAYDDTTWAASGMLFYQATSVDVSGSCSVTNSQSGIVFHETNGSVDGAIVLASDANNKEEGISVRDYGETKATEGGLSIAPAYPLAEEWQYQRGQSSAATTVTLTNLSLTGANQEHSYGIGVWAIGDDVNVTITKSTIQDCGIGVVAKDSVGSVTVVADSNTISGNDFGVWTNAASAQDFENNNWGTSDGPEDPDGTAEVYIGQCYSVDSMMNTVAELFPAEGLGNGVSDNVDYCPWIPWSCCVVRGDVDHSGAINVVDLIYLVDYLFFEGPAPSCFEEGDVDGVTEINVADLTYLVDYLFFSGPPPPPC